MDAITDILADILADIRAITELIQQNNELARRVSAKISAIHVKGEKGSNCSKSGAAYELMVWKVCKQIYYNEHPFCVMDKSELAGSGNGFDLTCWFGEMVIPIEIKKHNAPDWGQVTITVTHTEGTGTHTNTRPFWHAKRSKCSKTTSGVQDIFDALLKNVHIFGDKIPPPMIRDVTHAEWVEYKKNHGEFSDQYIRDCPDDLISQIYAAKNVQYIQVSTYGLYHTGDNPCGFAVPKFSHPTQLRIRVKVHSKCNARGFVQLSVTCAAQPILTNKKESRTALQPSPHSLDCIDRIPIISRGSPVG